MVVGTANFELKAGGDVLVLLSPVRHTVLKVSLSSDGPDTTVPNPDLLMHYQDRELRLKPVNRSGNQSQWKVWHQKPSIICNLDRVEKSWV
jgi:hypothetical protein